MAERELTSAVDLCDGRGRLSPAARVLHPFGRGFDLPDQVCTGVASIDTPKLRLAIDEQPTHTRITAWGPPPHQVRCAARSTSTSPSTSPRGTSRSTSSSPGAIAGSSSRRSRTRDRARCAWAIELDGIRGFAEEARNRW